MSIVLKLAKIQEEIGTIKKDSLNPYFKSKYFDINSLLEKIKPILSKHGMLLLQPLSNVDGKLALTTTLIDIETSKEISSITVLPECADAQKAGSAITYFRRYALQSFLALEAEDDDGNVASDKKIDKDEAKRLKSEKDRDNGVSPFEI